MKGYNGTIFAYGQTGTGKTYTMVGDFEHKTNRGIIPRAFDYIFEKVKEDKEHKYNIMVSFIQIYLESIQDLLEPTNKDIRIREDPEQGVYLEGVQWVKVNSTSDCANVFHFGEKNRVTECTKMNSHSSRSHAIFIARIEKNIMLSKEKIAELSKESNEQIKEERVMTRSNLYLVDLAGSERVKKTKAENMRLEEAKKINYSLLILGNCIQSLTEAKPTYVSYRDSKLTRLLQESLGGNAKTSLIVTVSPSGYNADETVSSLNFASRAMKVQNKPIINKSVDYQALSIKLQEDLDKLNDQYTLLKIDYDKVCEENIKLKNGETLPDKQQKSFTGDSNNNDVNDNKSKSSKHINDSNKNNNSQQSTEFYEQKIKRLETLLKSKNEEHESILKDIDKILLEKETLIEKLTKDNKSYQKRNESLTDTIQDLKKEKEDLMTSVSDLTNKLTYEIESNKTKNTQEHKAELDKLNSIIESLESKIIPLENMNSLNNDSIQACQKTIDQIIVQLKSEKANLQQAKSNLVIKTSQNEIKIKINNDEVENLKHKKQTVTDEMKKILQIRIEEAMNDIKKRQNENKKLNNKQQDLLTKIDQTDQHIKKYKALKEELLTMKQDEIFSKDKTEILCAAKLNEISSTVNKTKYEQNQIKLDSFEDDLIKLTNTYEELQFQHESLSKENEETKNRLNKLIKEHNVIKGEKTKLDSQNKQLSMQNKLLKDKSENLLKDLSQSQKKQQTEAQNVKNINTQLKNKTIEHEKLTHNLQTLTESHEKLKNEFSLKENELNLLTQQSKETTLNYKVAQNKITSLESQITSLQKELTSKETALTDSIAENENINKRILTKTNELIKIKQDAVNEQQSLNDIITQHEKEINSLTSQNKANTKTIMDLESTIKQLQSDLNVVQGDNESKEKELEKLTKEVSDNNIIITKYKTDIDTLTKENATLTTKYEQNVIKNTNNESKTTSHINELNKMIASKNNQIKSIQENNDLLTKQINEITMMKDKDNKQLNTQIKKKDDEINKLSKELQTAENELKDINTLNTNLKAENDKYKNENKKLKSELNLKDIKMSSMDQYTKTITEQASTIMKKNKEINEKKEELDEAKIHIENIKNENTQLKSEINALIQEKQEKELKITALNDLVNQKEKLISLNNENYDNLKNESNEIKEKYSTLLQEHSQIKKDTSKFQNETEKQATLVASQQNELNDIETKLLKLNKKLQLASNNYMKFQDEIKKIQTELKTSTNVPLDLAALNQMITEIEDSQSDDEDDKKQSTKKEDKNKPKTIIDKYVSNINEQLKSNNSKFNLLLTAYSDTLSKINKNNTDNTEFKKDLLENMHKILLLLSTSTNQNPTLKNELNSIITTNENKYNELTKTYTNLSTGTILALTNALNIESLSKLLSNSIDKQDEITHLSDRINYFLKEIELLKQNNSALSKGASTDLKTLQVKHESYMRLKIEEINKLHKSIEGHIRTIDMKSKQINKLNQELAEAKELLQKHNEKWEKQEKHNKIQKIKIDSKDINTGKFLLKEYFRKVSNFGTDIWNYCEIKNAKKMLQTCSSSTTNIFNSQLMSSSTLYNNPNESNIY